MKPRIQFNNLDEYRGEATVLEVAQRYDFDVENIVKAEFNENLFPPSPKVIQALTEFLLTNSSQFGKINTYPYEIDYKSIRHRIARCISNRLSEDDILLGNGSNEIIDLICKVFVEPSKEKVLLLEPTFGGYKVYLRTYNILIDSVICEDDLQFDYEKVLQRIDEDTKLCVICHPNNPTGLLFDKTRLVELITSFPNTLFFIDEAYIHYSKEKSSVVELAADYENVIISRSFSKAYGLAGLRVGLGISNRKNIEYMNKARVSYTANIFGVVAIDAILNDQEYVQKIVAETIKERNMVRENLMGLPKVEFVYPSEGNFLLIRFRDCDAKIVQQKMLKKGIILRDYSEMPKLANCLRMTIGPKKNNDRILRGLREVLM